MANLHLVTVPNLEEETVSIPCVRHQVVEFKGRSFHFNGA